MRAMELLEKGECDVLILDLNMPGLTGMEVLKKIKALEIPVEVIILTAHATVTKAIVVLPVGQRFHGN